MEGFKKFFEMSALMDIIGNVPQRPDYHFEGPVGAHTLLVRKQLEKAIGIIQKAASNPNSALSNLDTNYTDEDRNILRLAAWTHDLGKSSATRVNGINWKDENNPNLSQVKAIGHETPKHFNPAARELMKSPIWLKMFDNASLEDKKNLWFLVNNHMIGGMGMGKKMNRRWIDSNGKYLNDRKLKLLFAFVLMDKMGRISGMGKVDDESDFLKSLEDSAEKIKNQNKKQSRPATQDPIGFVKMVGDNMRKQGWSPGEISRNLKIALRKKSDKDKLGLSDEQIDDILKK